ncbi:hypothetical protein PGT21_030811 [Puccinia graminis f. sp. tritici]|uniref:Uncharacterized protein n=1 Tax=Puccinia graminis f. sp. tritici TaxID=56615 RepID=A0A5B0RBT1_PUCGR|nr:hypothetical protein PGT21_030811 [Puccinia graminis f. sp. tritici]KAA1122832.1 hypothetical protein PGTUg99_008161 [Puccinia graminis f. sp. tritici]
MWRLRWGSTPIAQIASPIDSEGNPYRTCTDGWAWAVSCCDQSKFDVLKKVDRPIKSIFITPKSFQDGCPKDKVESNN